MGEALKLQVHPDAIQTLSRNNISSEGLVPKDVATFSGQSFDYVITLCPASASCLFLEV